MPQRSYQRLWWFLNGCGAIIALVAGVQGIASLNHQTHIAAIAHIVIFYVMIPAAILGGLFLGYLAWPKAVPLTWQSLKDFLNGSSPSV